MSQKNSNALSKTHRYLLKNLGDNKIFQIYKKFDNNFKLKQNFIVAVSGGPDSLALAFLTKIYSIKKSLNIEYFIVDHGLRKTSSSEAKLVKKLLNKHNINLKVLKWSGIKPKSNIQSLAREKRYSLLINQAKKLNIRNIVVGHHIDDLYENFFIRIIRGSGLKGLSSLEKTNQISNINLIRPLLAFDKSDLIFISKHVFNFFVVDPSNKDFKYTRVRIRSFIDEFKKEGFDKNKLFLTIKNLRGSNQTLLFYVEQNKRLNSFLNQKKNELILNEHFFKNPHEVIFRSLIDSIKIIGGKYNTVRGKKIDNIFNKIQNNVLIKETLGGCIIKKLNQTVIISKED